MKKILLVSFLAVFSSLTVLAQSKTWEADKAHSRLGFTITHLGISDVSGLFKSFEASIVASKADFSDATVSLSADVNSIDTEVEMRDNHLRSADFFDAENH